MTAAVAFAGAVGSAALAASVTQPGETVGLATGAPLKEGLYFVNTGDWGCRDTDPMTCVGVDIPVGAWATPWTVLGGRIQFLVATPVIESGQRHRDYVAGVYNPFFAGQIAWDLGNGFGFSYLFGAYAGVNSDVAFDTTSLNHRFAISYTGNGFDLTANAIYGHHIETPDYARGKPANPDFVNLDLTATKKFGKFEVGPVAYMSRDLSRPTLTYLEQSQIAVGGLIGWDFGPVIVQAYVTHDVYQKNYGGQDTRFWSRIIVPVWTAPETPASPVIYRK